MPLIIGIIMNIVMKFALKFARSAIRKVINECFAYLKREAALTTNELDDKTVDYVHKAILEFFDNV